MSNITLIGIDLAKNVFHLHVVDDKGKQMKVTKLSRLKLAEYLYRSEPVIVAMEACASAHYWGRLCTSLGHRTGYQPRAVGCGWKV
ncbi:TPA: hypothetical protein PXM37_004254 [Yersinia enterocolitica]|nr:hypothetical protein [Yersinia enterocolitica]HDL6985301.1 hypothetical protein [Yersinia enterocolitica]HDL7067843.1 hypothetical protein [Yersinia enterocolitica]HDL7072233.1 hypothetical protein [Yersinia enterocolitica]